MCIVYLLSITRDIKTAMLICNVKPHVTLIATSLFSYSEPNGDSLYGEQPSRVGELLPNTRETSYLRPNYKMAPVNVMVML